MGQKSAWKTMSSTQRYLMYDVFLAYFAMGIYLILIGSALPSIKEEYHISYQIGGFMMSVQQIGYLVIGIFISLIARRFGAKPTYLFFGILAFVGLAIMMATGNPYLLLFAMLLTGLCKGSTANFGNQMVSTLSNNDSSLLNLAQAFFAVGACAAPVIAMVCGASWRMAFGITIAIGIVSFVHGLRVEIGEEAYPQKAGDGTIDLGFFKYKIFWICCLLLLCYLAFEASVMGWLVTFLVDSAIANETTAQLLATGLWVAVLAGRLLSAWLATKFQPYQMITVMTIGITICFTLMMFSHTILWMTIAVIGVGLFMAGMYGTALGGSDDLIGRYPMCMGMFIVIPGIGAAVTQSAIGMIADRIGIRGGMYVLYVLIVILFVATALFAGERKKG